MIIWSKPEYRNWNCINRVLPSLSLLQHGSVYPGLAAVILSLDTSGAHFSNPKADKLRRNSRPVRRETLRTAMLRRFLSAVTLTLAVVAPTGFATAQNTLVSYLSGIAPQSNTVCSRTAPCSDFNTALAQTLVGGTIICLDVVRGGTFTVTKSVTIDCSAGPAIIAGAFSDGQPTGAAVVINLAQEDTFRSVRLIGFRFNAGYGSIRLVQNGITILSANSVSLEQVKIENMIRAGVLDIRSGGQTRLLIKDSEFRDNGVAGVLAAAGAVGITVLDNVKLENNAHGLAAASGNVVTINRSVSAGNTTAGIEADPGAQVNISGSVLSNNTVNVQAFGTVRLRENDIQFSNTALQGAAVSMGGNRFSANGTIGSVPSLASGAPPDVFN
jgi:hypothetical protein